MISTKMTKMGKGNAEFAFWLLQIGLTLSCLGLFLYLMLDSYEKFTSKRTTVGVAMIPFDLKLKYPPCITICALEAFRKSGFHYKEKDYIEQTFNIEEILQNRKYYGNIEIISVFNESLYSIDEVRTVHLGRCYKLCQKHWLIEDVFSYLVYVHDSRDLKVFVHDKEDTKWVAMGKPAKTISCFDLEMTIRPKIISYEVTLVEKKITLEIANGQCKNYTSENGYDECSETFFAKFFKTRINCTIAGMPKVLDNLFPTCYDEEMAHWTHLHYLELVYRNGKQEWLSECPVPCTQTMFDFSIQKHHQNSILQKGNSSYPFANDAKEFFVQYEKYVTEEHVETLIYDIGNFLAQAGGNLGLCLGFSCLSILVAVGKFVKKILK